MVSRWWEGIAIFLADYWFIWLGFLVVLVIAIFTRNLWMPLFGF